MPQPQLSMREQARKIYLDFDRIFHVDSHAAPAPEYSDWCRVCCDRNPVWTKTPLKPEVQNHCFNQLLFTRRILSVCEEKLQVRTHGQSYKLKTVNDGKGDALREVQFHAYRVGHLRGRSPYGTSTRS